MFFQVTVRAHVCDYLCMDLGTTMSFLRIIVTQAVSLPLRRIDASLVSYHPARSVALAVCFTPNVS